MIIIVGIMALVVGVGIGMVVEIFIETKTWRDFEEEFNEQHLSKPFPSFYHHPRNNRHKN